MIFDRRYLDTIISKTLILLSTYVLVQAINHEGSDTNKFCYWLTVALTISSIIIVAVWEYKEQRKYIENANKTYLLIQGIFVVFSLSYVLSNYSYRFPILQMSLYKGWECYLYIIVIVIAHVYLSAGHIFEAVKKYKEDLSNDYVNYLIRIPGIESEERIRRYIQPSRGIIFTLYSIMFAVLGIYFYIIIFNY